MKKHDRMLSIMFVIIMMATYMYWAFATNSWTIMGTVAATVCFLLFLLIGLRTIPTLSSFILSNKPDAELSENKDIDRKWNWLTIICWMLVSRVLLLVLGYALFIINNGYSGGLFERVIDIWRLSGIDAWSYLGIAENGYVTEGDSRFHIVFFPFFPNLIQLVYFFVGNYLVAGFIVSNLFAIVAALFAYELASMDMQRKAAMRVVKYIFIFPAAFFFLIPMTESLFLALSLICIYCVRKKEWMLGCLIGAMASFTRSPGVLLLVPVAIEMARDVVLNYRMLDNGRLFRRITSAIACLAIIPVGLLLYLYINYSVTGNPFQFSIYQKEHWSQSFYLFFDTVRYQTEHAVRTFLEGDKRRFLGLWLPGLVSIFSVLVIMLKSAKKLRPSYTAYFIVYFVFVIGATWLLSAPRYFAVAFPIAFAVALLTKDKAKDAAFTTLFIVGSVLYLAVFIAGYPVY